MNISQLVSLTKLSKRRLHFNAKKLKTPVSIEKNRIILTPKQIQIVAGETLEECHGKIIYVGNLKGGVGKTSIVYMLADVLSSIGYKCLLIDVDTQANLTSQYIHASQDLPSFYDIIEGKVKAEDATVKINEQIDIVPSSLKNSLIQKSLSSQKPKHFKKWLDEICLDVYRDKYDIILIDTPPHLTTLNSIFCLCLDYKDHLIIPVNPDEFGVDGIKMFLEDYYEIRNSFSVDEETKISILINKFRGNQRSHLEMISKISEEFGPLLSETAIKEAAKINEIVTKKQHIFEVKRDKEIIDTMRKLLIEIGVIKNG